MGDYIVGITTHFKVNGKDKVVSHIGTGVVIDVEKVLTSLTKPFTI